jgi:methyl-accepting chemotaxis protein
MSIVVQVIVVWRTMRSTDDAVSHLSRVSVDLERDARNVLTQFQGIVSGLEHLKSVFENLANRADDVNRMVESRSRDLDQLVDRFVEVGTRQADKVDETVSDTMAKFRQTTDVIQQDLLRPIVEIASVIQGLKVGVDYLFSKKPGSPSARDFPDDDLFI